MKLIGIQTSESHNRHPVTLILPVRSLYRRPLASLLCLCPVRPLAAHAQRAPVPVAQTVLRLRHHLKAALSRRQTLQAQDNNNISQFVTINITRTVRDGALFQQPAGWYERETRTCSDEETDGRSERTTAMDHRLEASSHSAAKPTEASLSASSSKHATSPISPKTSV